MNSALPNPKVAFPPERSATLAILNHAKAQVRPIFEKAIQRYAIPPSAQPKFKWPIELPPFGDPWKHFDKHECVGLYVVRDVNGVPADVEVVVEIESFRFPDKDDPDDAGDVELGNCFRLTGEQDWLSLEEEEEAKEAFKNSYGTQYEEDYDARD